MKAMIDRKKIALIHIIKKKLALSDEAYRKLLHDAVGVTSSKDLNDAQFQKLMNVFVRSKHYRRENDGISLRQRLYVEHLVQDIGWGETQFSDFLNKYYHQNKLSQFSKQEAGKLIASLKNILDHY